MYNSFMKFSCKKLLILFAFIFVSFNLFAGVRLYKQKVPLKKQYVMYVKAFDWGAVTTKVVCNAGTYLLPEKFTSLTNEDFTVSVILMPSGISTSSVGIKKGERSIERVFLSDEYGNKTEGKSSYFTIEFVLSPAEENADPFVHNFFLNGRSQEFYGYRIESETLDMKITNLAGIVCPEAAVFKFGVMQDDQNSIQYAVYENESRLQNKNSSSALIVWMHGIAEGGTNPYIPLLGTKTVNLSSQEIQKYFPGGADLIVPQCPTGWLETITTDIFGYRMWAPIDIEGTVKKYTKPVKEFLGAAIPVPQESDENKVSSASVSYYTEIIRKIIDDYIERHPYIDRNRIYIGGCSAGGYMTINMILQNPDLFAAAFTACEAYPDSKINRKQLEILSKIPLWMVHSQNDTTIKPENHDLDTVRRLREEGWDKNLHYTLYPDVKDLTSSWFMEDGSPWQFDCHASWIYVLNNDPKENGITLFEWLSKQKKDKN